MSSEILRWHFVLDVFFLGSWYNLCRCCLRCLDCLQHRKEEGDWEGSNKEAPSRPKILLIPKEILGPNFWARAPRILLRSCLTSLNWSPCPKIHPIPSYPTCSTMVLPPSKDSLFKVTILIHIWICFQIKNHNLCVRQLFKKCLVEIDSQSEASSEERSFPRSSDICSNSLWQQTKSQKLFSILVHAVSSTRSF